MAVGYDILSRRLIVTVEDPEPSEDDNYILPMTVDNDGKPDGYIFLYGPDSDILFLNERSPITWH